LSTAEEIRANIERYLIELQDEIESLRGALTALDAQAAALPQSVAASRGGEAVKATSVRRARRTGRPRRSPERQDQPAADPELERLLAETGGMSAVELAKQTGTDPAEVLARIRELERAGGG
jgi:hypothetical protein